MRVSISFSHNLSISHNLSLVLCPACNQHNPPRANSLHNKTRASSSMTTHARVYAPGNSMHKHSYPCAVFVYMCRTCNMRHTYMHIHIQHTHILSYTAHAHPSNTHHHVHKCALPTLARTRTNAHTHTHTTTRKRTHAHAQKHECMRRRTHLRDILRETLILLDDFFLKKNTQTTFTPKKNHLGDIQLGVNWNELQWVNLHVP